MKRDDLPHYLVDMLALERMQHWDVGGAADDQRARLEAGGFVKDGEITKRGWQAINIAERWPVYKRYVRRLESDQIGQSELDALMG